jgi:hypothetical protein
MEIVTFAIWKFRHIEGLLQGMHASDIAVTKYIDPVTKLVSWIRYDYKAETAVIEHTTKKDSIWSLDGGDVVTETVECKFDELIGKLKELGMYVERGEHDRHHLAGPQKEDE